MTAFATRQLCEEQKGVLSYKSAFAPVMGKGS